MLKHIFWFELLLWGLLVHNWLKQHKDYKLIKIYKRKLVFASPWMGFCPSVFKILG